MPEYDYSFEREVTAAHLMPLFAQTAWAKNRAPEHIAPALAHSVNIGVWDGDRLIAFARAVTDTRFRAYIEDVVVDEAYRGHDIGTKMVRLLLAKFDHIEEIILATSEELVPFYENVGFKRFLPPRMNILRP